MSPETLEPGWLHRDTEKASERVREWTERGENMIPSNREVPKQEAQ